MKPAKYVRNQHRFLAFSDSLVHREVARKSLGGNALIHGAGFMTLNVVDGQIVANCFGRSESLDVDPRRDDHSTILPQIGVGTDAKYVIVHGRVVVFSTVIDEVAVRDGAFFGPSKAYSAGFVRLSVDEDNKIKVECHGKLDGIDESSNKNDYLMVAQALGIAGDHLSIVKE